MDKIGRRCHNPSYIVEHTLDMKKNTYNLTQETILDNWIKTTQLSDLKFEKSTTEVILGEQSYIKYLISFPFPI